MHRPLALVALVVVVSSLPSQSPASGGLTVAQAETDLQKLGGRAFIDKHFEKDTWRNLLHGIESANARWLAIGERLKPQADAGSSEDLAQALFAALAVKPLRVLPVLMRIYGSSPAELCNQTFEAELPKEGVNAYLSAIERGLKQAKSPVERAHAAQCMLGLESSRKYAREHGLK